MDSETLYTILNYNGMDYTKDLIRRLVDTYNNHIHTIEKHIYLYTYLDKVKVFNTITKPCNNFYNNTINIKLKLKYGKEDNEDLIDDIINDFHHINIEFNKLNELILASSNIVKT